MSKPMKYGGGLLDRGSHRGYYIVKSLSTDSWYVSKDGMHITSAPSFDAAKREVDALLDPQEN